MAKKRKRNKDGSIQKTVPAMCKKCGYFATADPEQAERIMAVVEGSEQALKVMWETIGRALQDAYTGRCPIQVYPLDKELPNDWCKGCEDFVRRDPAGDILHPFWKCWMYWVGEQMKGGPLTPSKIAEKVQELQDQEGEDDERKTDSKSDPS